EIADDMRREVLREGGPDLAFFLFRTEELDCREADEGEKSRSHRRHGLEIDSRLSKGQEQGGGDEYNYCGPHEDRLRGVQPENGKGRGERHERRQDQAVPPGNLLEEPALEDRV